jgi:hypothetical protein
MHHKTITQGETTSYMSGWISFAGFLMVVAGVFHMITGLVAIFKPSFYVTTSSHLLVFDYGTWGWTHLIWGMILLLSAGSLFAGRMWGRVVAIILATLSAILNFGFISAYPIWSILIIVLDIIIIYSVAMYGSESE